MQTPQTNDSQEFSRIFFHSREFLDSRESKKGREIINIILDADEELVVILMYIL